MEWFTGFSTSIENSIEVFGLFFFASLFLSLMLTPLSAKFAFLVGAIDQPKNRSVHKLAMPRLGGLGMAVALGISVLFFLPISNSPARSSRSSCLSPSAATRSAASVTSSAVERSSSAQQRPW
jgi:UDP-N-acetylmuramyl pentapeptide phosphotransferase/UDP-N-acetylglucosamine-1-phosphate transferase